jgi:hypothetical protein
VDNAPDAPDLLLHAVALTRARIGPDTDELAIARFDGRVREVVCTVAARSGLTARALTHFEEELEAQLNGWIDETLTRPAEAPGRRLVPLAAG